MYGVSTATKSLDQKSKAGKQMSRMIASRQGGKRTAGKLYPDSKAACRLVPTHHSTTIFAFHMLESPHSQGSEAADVLRQFFTKWSRLVRSSSAMPKDRYFKAIDEKIQQVNILKMCWMCRGIYTQLIHSQTAHPPAFYSDC